MNMPFIHPRVEIVGCCSLFSVNILDKFENDDKIKTLF